MRIYQKVTAPALHGNGPRNLAMAIRKPHAPAAKRKFKTLKDAMEYYKERDEEVEEKYDEE